MNCEQELCEHWTGDGNVCVCALFADAEPETPGVVMSEKPEAAVPDYISDAQCRAAVEAIRALLLTRASATPAVLHDIRLLVGLEAEDPPRHQVNISMPSPESRGVEVSALTRTAYARGLRDGRNGL